MFDNVVRGIQESGLLPLSPEFDKRLQVGYTVFLADTWEQGRKVWGKDGWMFELLEPIFLEMGAQTVDIAFSELFTSLQTGVVHAQDNAPLVTFEHLRDVTKFYTDVNLLFEPVVLMMNKDLWDKQSPVNQKAIMDAAMEESARFIMIWSIFIGAVVTTREDSHICMGGFVSSPKGKAIFNVISKVITLLFLCIFVKWSYEYALHSYSKNMSSIVLDVPLIVVHSCFIVTGSLMTLHTFLHLLKQVQNVRQLFRGDTI